MAHKKRSKGTGKYATEHHREKNKVAKMETYVRKNPNNLEAAQILQKMKEDWKSFL